MVLLMSAPGIGRRFAERLHAELAISTLEDLEAAAYDGRLATVAGFGDKRLAGIRDTLAHRLGRARRHSGTAATAPPVTELLDVDREYREGGCGHPQNNCATPLQSSSRGLASSASHDARTPPLYGTVFQYCSRTPTRQDPGLGRPLQRRCHRRQQHTVITANYGPLRGCRVVAGRERECVRPTTSTAA